MKMSEDEYRELFSSHAEIIESLLMEKHRLALYGKQGRYKDYAISRGDTEVFLIEQLEFLEKCSNWDIIGIYADDNSGNEMSFETLVADIQDGKADIVYLDAGCFERSEEQRNERISSLLDANQSVRLIWGTISSELPYDKSDRILFFFQEMRYKERMSIMRSLQEGILGFNPLIKNPLHLYIDGTDSEAKSIINEMIGQDISSDEIETYIKEKWPSLPTRRIRYHITRIRNLRNSLYGSKKEEFILGGYSIEKYAMVPRILPNYCSRETSNE